MINPAVSACSFIFSIKLAKKYLHFYPFCCLLLVFSHKQIITGPSQGLNTHWIAWGSTNIKGNGVYMTLSLCLSWDWRFGQQWWALAALPVRGHKPGCLQCHHWAQLPGHHLTDQVCPEPHDPEEERQDCHCEQCDGHHGSSSCHWLLCQQARSAGELVWELINLIEWASTSAVAESFVLCRKHKSQLKFHQHRQHSQVLKVL